MEGDRNVRDECRSRHRSDGDPGFTLLELLIVTVVLSILALIVAKPVLEVRERAMLGATQAHVRNIITAIDRYQVIEGTLPDDIADLEPVGIVGGGSIEVCWFQLTPATAGRQAFVSVGARYERGRTVVTTRHPLHSGRLKTMERTASSGPCYW